jgi:peptide/nickel transport system substrate-binding protein
VKFHDGSLLTSADVRATYERLIKPPPGVLSARQALYQDISGIDTPDDHTIVFRLSAYNAGMLDAFASRGTASISAAKLESEIPETNVLAPAPSRSSAMRKGRLGGKRFGGYFRQDVPTSTVSDSSSSPRSRWLPAAIRHRVSRRRRSSATGWLPDEGRAVVWRVHG